MSKLARVNNTGYRMAKSVTPGPYTFILEATKEVPRRLSHPSKKTIGLRVPSNKALHALLEKIGEPLGRHDGHHAGRGGTAFFRLGNSGSNR